MKQKRIAIAAAVILALLLGSNAALAGGWKHFKRYDPLYVQDAQTVDIQQNERRVLTVVRFKKFLRDFLEAVSVRWQFTRVDPEVLMLQSASAREFPRHFGPRRNLDLGI